MKIFGREVINWGNIEQVPPTERKAKVLEAICHFMKKVADIPLGGIKSAAHDSNLSGPSPIILVTSDTVKTPDRGYEVLFDEVDMRQSSNSAFEVLDVTGGVTFYQQEPGEEAKLSKIPTSAKTSVGFLRFIGGFPILDDWFRFNQYYKIDELTRDTITRWFEKKAVLFYGLLTSLGAGINQAFATDDVTTINNACAQIITDLEAAGYAVDENAAFVITCHPTLKARIMKALANTFLNPNGNSNQIVFNVNTLITSAKVANTSYYVSLPGGKNKRGEWDDLQARPPQRNELKLGADHVWTGAYNGIIGESKQHRRCSLA